MQKVILILVLQIFGIVRAYCYPVAPMKVLSDQTLKEVARAEYGTILSTQSVAFGRLENLPANESIEFQINEVIFGNPMNKGKTVRLNVSSDRWFPEYVPYRAGSRCVVLLDSENGLISVLPAEGVRIRPIGTRAELKVAIKDIAKSQWERQVQGLSTLIGVTRPLFTEEEYTVLQKRLVQAQNELQKNK